MRRHSIVRLSEEERAQLHTLVGGGTAAARTLTHARILLKANQGEAGPGRTDGAIATALDILPDRPTLEREVAAWEAERHATTRTIDWRFM